MYFPYEQEAVTFCVHIKLLAHTVPQIRKRRGKKKFQKKLIPRFLSQISLGQKKNSKILDFFFLPKASVNTETITTYHIRVVSPVKITHVGVSGHETDFFIS